MFYPYAYFQCVVNFCVTSEYLNTFHLISLCKLIAFSSHGGKLVYLVISDVLGPAQSCELLEAEPQLGKPTHY